MLINKRPKETIAVLRRQAEGCGHQPPVGDQTHFGYGKEGGAA
jgi:hypothetical protein